MPKKLEFDYENFDIEKFLNYVKGKSKKNKLKTGGKNYDSKGSIERNHSTRGKD